MAQLCLAVPMSLPANERHPVLHAALWMTGAITSFSFLAIGVREASREIGTFEILFIRNAIGIVIIGALLFRSGWHQLHTMHLKTHIVRNLAHYGGQFGWAYAIVFISLAEVFAIEFTVPLWTAVAAALLLGERITRTRMIAIGLGILGVLVILRPGLGLTHPAALAVLAGAVCWGLSLTLTRQIAQHDSVLAVLWYMSLVQLPIGLIPSLIQWVTPSAAVWGWLVVVAIVALTAHYCLANAMRHADAAIVTTMDFLRLPLIAIIGWLVYAEKLDIWIVAGALLMLGGNLLNVRKEQRKT